MAETRLGMPVCPRCDEVFKAGVEGQREGEICGRCQQDEPECSGCEEKSAEITRLLATIDQRNNELRKLRAELKHLNAFIKSGDGCA